MINQARLEVPAKNIITLGLILTTLQLLDGVLTGIGVHLFGTSIEANYLLRFLMEHIGAVPALLFTKLLAVVVIVALCFAAQQVKWLATAFKATIVYYVVLAIIPWAYIFISSANIF